MRKSWDEYFLQMAMLVSQRATCPRLHCGCVLVRDRRVLAVGYNGSLPEQEHCEDIGCLMIDNHCQRTLHAEQNAIMYAAKYGIRIEGAECYVTTMPCIVCAKLLVASGITKVITFSKYTDDHAINFLQNSKITVLFMHQPSKEIVFEEKKYPSFKKLT